MVRQNVLRFWTLFTEYWRNIQRRRKLFLIRGGGWNTISCIFGCVLRQSENHKLLLLLNQKHSKEYVTHQVQRIKIKLPNFVWIFSYVIIHCGIETAHLFSNKSKFKLPEISLIQNILRFIPGSYTF